MPAIIASNDNVRATLSKAGLTKERYRLSSFSGNDEWFTPSKYIEMARKVLSEIDLDPASNVIAQKVVKAKKFFTTDNSGLEKPWFGCVWMNPPYSRTLIDRFIGNLISEYQVGNVSSAVVLTNNAGDTRWHHAIAAASSAMCLPRGRIRFESPMRESNSPAMGQSFFYLGRSPGVFADVFSSIGLITRNYVAANDNLPAITKAA